ncbi:head-tail connector protein [Lentilactobacillus buchneri]|uniref:head-tail connector protein n=1 Tax=Lentilactobacillus buchneri TaxID=1581 RepID=UPI0021A49DA9|nr:head-tail connector protein [Lentilactobacillus buchneri]
MADTATDLLNELKDSLHVPLDVTDDDSLLTDYIYSAKAYLNNACNKDMSLDDRYKFIVIELATLYYQNRGVLTTVKDFPYSLRVLINQIKI